MKSPLVVGLIGTLVLLLSGSIVAEGQKPAGVIDSVDAEWSGIQTDLLEVKRMSDNTIRVRYRYRNTTDQRIHLDRGEMFHALSYLLDPVNNKKHLVVTDAKNYFIGSWYDPNSVVYVEPKKSVAFWAKFPAPPPDVQKITVVVAKTPPFEDVPIAK